jgi:hypothetical protein
LFGLTASGLVMVCCSSSTDEARVAATRLTHFQKGVGTDLDLNTSDPDGILFMPFITPFMQMSGYYVC